MISNRIYEEIEVVLISNVSQIEIKVFEQILKMRDDMIMLNEADKNPHSIIATQLLEEILQAFLEKLLNKIIINKKKGD
jgi:hypothetical protein